MPILGDQDHVFPADAAPGGIVEAGFHGDDHAGREDVFAAPPQTGRFVGLQTHAMAQAVGEELADILGVEIITGQGVDFGTGHAGTDTGNSAGLGFAHQVHG